MSLKKTLIKLSTADKIKVIKRVRRDEALNLPRRSLVEKVLPRKKAYRRLPKHKIILLTDEKV